jgi:hypothetical protein
MGKIMRVNIGGHRYVDSSGNVWQEDKAYHSGSYGCLDMPTTDILKTTDEISGTNDQTLFQTMRVGEKMRYRFDLPNGKYRVCLMFAEIYWESSDAEEEDVYIQGNKVLSHFNIFDVAGHDNALCKAFVTQVTEEQLAINFVGISLPMHAGARACAIEVEAINGN